MDLAVTLSHETLPAEVVWTAYRVLPVCLPLMPWVDLDHTEEIIYLIWPVFDFQLYCKYLGSFWATLQFILQLIVDNLLIILALVINEPNIQLHS